MTTLSNISLNLPSSVQEDINFLKNLFKPYTSRVYIVGGTLRNHFLNTINNSNDIDIEVHGISTDTFDTLMNHIKASGVGKSFFVYKYKDIDISLGRVESKIAYGHTGFEVALAQDEKTASIRRDFTMNALMLNIYTNEVLDFHNGLNDIKNKVLKIVNKTSFFEDSLRVLRAVRFASIYDLKIDINSLNIMKTMDIDDLSTSRISTELKKIFKSSYTYKGLYYLIVTNIFYKLFSYRISIKEFIYLYRYIKKASCYYDKELYELYFLFILKKCLNIDFMNLNLPNRYKQINKEPYILDTISDEELLYLATFKSINKYLDATNIIIINKAKKLNIYYNILEINIDVKIILDAGFIGKDIALQIEEKKKQYIKNLLLSHNVVTDIN